MKEVEYSFGDNDPIHFSVFTISHGPTPLEAWMDAALSQIGGENAG